MIYDYPSIREVHLICNLTTLGVVAPLGYNGLLILSCTFYAFKVPQHNLGIIVYNNFSLSCSYKNSVLPFLLQTRNVPANFNEAKYIAFTMYTTCIIWLAFVPIYFGSNYKIITMCFSVSLSATVALCCMFVPKVRNIFLSCNGKTHAVLRSYFVVHFCVQVYIMLAKPEKNVRSAFTTSTVVRMHVGDAKKVAKTGKSSSSMANLFRRRGSAHDNIRYVGDLSEY